MDRLKPRHQRRSHPHIGAMVESEMGDPATVVHSGSVSVDAKPADFKGFSFRRSQPRNVKALTENGLSVT
jgi:hypothetical protein